MVVRRPTGVPAPRLLVREAATRRGSSEPSGARFPKMSENVRSAAEILTFCRCHDRARGKEQRGARNETNPIKANPNRAQRAGIEEMFHRRARASDETNPTRE